MKTPAKNTGPAWNGIERRIAGNYAGRPALLLPADAVQQQSAMAMQVWKNPGPRSKPADKAGS